MNAPVVFIFAMQKEAEGFLAAISAKPQGKPWSPLPAEVFAAPPTPCGTPVWVVCLGEDPRHRVDSIGAVPAALTAHRVIEKFKPRLIINAGTAGGYESRGAKIAEVYQGSKGVVFHDRRNPMPQFDEYGVGGYPTTSMAELGFSWSLPEGRVTTGGNLGCNEEDQAVIDRTDSSLKEMEAGGIGYVCELFGVPLLPIKGITDFVDHAAATEVQFYANLEKTRDALAGVLVRMLEEL